MGKSFNASSAIEPIHSASLVHDDIIDNDLIRRGQKTLFQLLLRDMTY